jgi:hypothetical protein
VAISDARGARARGRAAGVRAGARADDRDRGRDRDDVGERIEHGRRRYHDHDHDDR